METLEEKTKNLKRLLQASREGDIEVVRALLERGNVDFSGVADDVNGSTSLKLASVGGYLSVVEVLLKAGADPNVADKDGRTPLHEVSRKGRLPFVQLLLAAGADLNVADKDGGTPLHEASRKGYWPIVQLLLEAGADHNAVTENGSTPLKLASVGGCLPVVEVLLTAGASPNAADKDGGTPLHWASVWGHWPVVEVLLTAGADRNAVTKNGSTSLKLASVGGYLPVVEVLLEAGADPNVADKDGRTPLHEVSRKGRLPFVELLVKRGADHSAANKITGETPLHCACGFARSHVARALLALGADLHAKDKKGRKPIHFCILPRSNGFDLASILETLQVLVSMGTKWDTKCDELVSSGKACEEAPAIRICMLLWTQENLNGLPFSKIPLEVIKRGVHSTQTYIGDRKTSTAVVIRRKICLVGSSCSGKTSLVKSMISEQPQLEHVDDRTIGIDHFPLRFYEPSTVSDDKSKTHEVTFWDFAGQDAYQVAHSLFFSPRTLYLVCVDLGAFTIAYMQAVIFADHDFQETKLLDEFVEDSVVRWVRLIVARQPDAEFVFIATKEDTLADNQVTEELLKQSLMDKLMEVNTNVRIIKKPKEKDAQLEDDISMSLTGLWKKGATAVQWMTGQLKTEDNGKTTHIPKRQVGVATIEPTVVFVSCTSLTSTQDATTKIKDLILKSDCSFEMPDTYTRVLKEIIQIREAAKAKGIATRISQVFAPVDSLPAKLDIEPEMCRTILQTLHDLGDVLWYEDLEIPLFWNRVILEPLFLIDFIRQIFNHKNTGQILSNYDLKTKEYWVGLDDDEKQMKAMKQLLQAFHLVYSADEYRVMECDSDLIVPAFWQTKTPASWKFLGDILRINSTRSHEDEAVRVHWEYDFKFALPSPFFDHLVVASVSPGFAFDAGPDWIMYKEGEVAACRIMVSRDPRSLHRTIDVEAVVSKTASEEQVNKLWGSFELLTGAFVKVLREYPGLRVPGIAWTDDESKPKENMKDLLWSTSTMPFGKKWMPPAETWERFKRLATDAQEKDDGWEGI